MELIDYWPLFGLRITTPRLELRVPTDDDLIGLVDAVRAGIHDPASTPFATSWTDAESPELEAAALRYWWRCRAGFSAEAWDLTLAVQLDGVVVGMQNLMANDFARLRVAATGSWLSLEHQGKGIGKEMRRAVLHLAFTKLDARAIESAAFTDNIASQRVSLAVGYEPNGVGTSRRREGVSEDQRFRISRQRWEETRTDLAIEVHGFERCRSMFGLDS